MSCKGCIKSQNKRLENYISKYGNIHVLNVLNLYRCVSSELTSPGVSRNTNCVLPSIPIALALHLVVCTLLEIEQTCKKREQISHFQIK